MRDRRGPSWWWRQARESRGRGLFVGGTLLLLCSLLSIPIILFWPETTPAPDKRDPESVPEALIADNTAQPARVSPAETFPPSPAMSPTAALSPTSTPPPQPTATPSPAPSETPTPTYTPTPTPSPPVAGAVPAQVVTVVDGDTLEVSIDGVRYRLQYIGVDLPERSEPFGLEAAAINEELVGGRTIWLVKDISETDPFDRLLRYVYLSDGTFVNAELVRLGYGVAVAYPPDVTHAETFALLEAEARSAGIGRWASTESTPVTASDLTPSSVSELTPASVSVVIVEVNKVEEYVDLQNVSESPVDLTGWRLLSERGYQECSLGGVLQPGQILRVWAMAEDAGRGGYNCGFSSNIWNNSQPDPAVLFDPQGNVVASY